MKCDNDAKITFPSVKRVKQTLILCYKTFSFQNSQSISPFHRITPKLFNLPYDHHIVLSKFSVFWAGGIK